MTMGARRRHGLAVCVWTCKQFRYQHPSTDESVVGEQLHVMFWVTITVVFALGATS